MSEYASQTSDSPESPRRHAEVVPTRAQLAARREFRRALRRARNPLYIPFAWLVLTLTIILLALAGIVALVASLRGEAAPALEPRIAIVTADILRVASAITPATTPAVDDSDYAPQVILAPDTPASIILTGPAVPTVIITNTPVPLAVGLQAIVSNVGNDELNVRNLPSVRGSEVLFRAPAGTLFNIIGGPQQADGYSWWQLHDPEFEVIGWAVANYLQTTLESTGQK